MSAPLKEAQDDNQIHAVRRISQKKIPPHDTEQMPNNYDTRAACSSDTKNILRPPR